MSWKVPTDAEFKTLEEYLGMTSTEADKAGVRGTNEGSKMAGHYSLWASGALRDNTAFGDSNLDLPPAGLRYDTGAFNLRGSNGLFWSLSESGSKVWYRLVMSSSTGVIRSDYTKANGLSVRCFREATSAEQTDYDDFEVLTDFYKGNDDTLYDCVKIGTQIWLAENLRETKFANGDTITLITNTSSSTTDAHRYIYDNEASVDETYGYLYNWPAVDDSRDITGEDASEITDTSNFFQLF